MAAKIDKKSKLERRLEREEKQAETARVQNERRQKLEQARKDRAAARSHTRTLRELLSVFRKECPVAIHDGVATFTFKGSEYDIRYGDWTIGGNSADVDDYKTEHEGWCLYAGRKITDIFEVRRFSDPPQLKPTPQEFAKELISILRHIDREPEYFGLAPRRASNFSRSSL